MKVTKFEDVTGLFSGIGDLFIFAEIVKHFVGSLDSEHYLAFEAGEYRT